MIRVVLEKQLHGATGELPLSVDFSIQPGELIAIYGDSGAGKTSLLRMLAGLLTPDSGRIVVEQEIWYDHANKVNIPIQKRHVGFVFQDYALFPNMTVRNNLKFALPRSAASTIIEEMVAIFELDELIDRSVTTLSGGQKQRVALARAMAQQPRILLLDEPFAALDYAIRLKLQEYLHEVHNSYGVTTIIVSHDVGEIMRLADQVIHLENGQILFFGSPTKLFGSSEVSGKFKFSGKVVKIERQGFVAIIHVLIQNEVIKVLSDWEEIADLSIADQVVVVSKAFNPILIKANADVSGSDTH